KYVNGATLVVDGGGWLYRPRVFDREVIQEVSRAVERRSRKAAPGAGAPASGGQQRSKL
ncbi:hypothetical protein CLOP_g21610, partial [Closterium sp. NIES-67]